jgi:TolB-like protein/class 3 adenylate cyclase/Flp pilus assembly protein TadD
MNSQSGKLAVILHADVAGSTQLVHQDEHLAHERFQQAFNRFGEHIKRYQGHVLELRGDALIAEFERASDAVSATLSFQLDHAEVASRLSDDIKPAIRVGIALGEIVIADNTVTGAGVVLAQRVEQLSDAGGVCISSAVHEALPRRMPFDLENLGDQDLKGFDDSVRIYRVRPKPGMAIPSPQAGRRSKLLQTSRFRLGLTIIVVLAMLVGIFYSVSPDNPPKEPALASRMAHPLPDKPSIAVLPFNNLSDDANQEYFADGMTEDLITDLSKITGLFVIARNSSFSFKDRQVKVRQVAEELGVRYVLEGSVRRAGDQVRINAQLIDATTGGHIWADRYDGTYEDVFALQDGMTAKIISALSLELSPQDEVQLAKSDTASPEAYDEFLKGWELRWRVNRESYARAEQHFKNALEYDPEYARAHAGLALLYMQIWQQDWHQDSGLQSAGWHRAQVHLEAAMSNPDSLTHSLRSTLELFKGNHEKAINEARQAVALNPGSAEGHLVLAEALSYSGEHMEAIYNVELAQRLDPNLPGAYMVVEGRALFDRGAYQGTLRTLDKALQTIPDDTQSLIYQIAAYGHLGDTDYAGLALNQLNNLLKSDNLPPFTLSALRNRLPYKSQEALQHLRDGLMKGGVPER